MRTLKSYGNPIIIPEHPHLLPQMISSCYTAFTRVVISGVTGKYLKNTLANWSHKQNYYSISILIWYRLLKKWFIMKHFRSCEIAVHNFKSYLKWEKKLILTITSIFNLTWLLQMTDFFFSFSVLPNLRQHLALSGTNFLLGI